MKDRFNQILIRYRPQLVNEMECSDLLNLLMSKNVLTQRQVRSIQCIVDPYKQNEAIIDALHRRPDEDFDRFCEALIHTGQKHIVYDYLKPGSKPDAIPEVSAKLETLGIQVRDVYRTSEQQQSSVVQETTVNNVEQPVIAANTTQPQRQPVPEWKLAGGPLSIDDITVVPSTEEFYERHKDDSYPMSRPCRGKLLLVCNEEFDSPSTTDPDQQLSDRRGAEVDVYNVSMLFKRLQFHVLPRSNLTAAEMLSEASRVASDESLRDDDCFALCVMSHGQLRVMPASDGNTMRCECVFGVDGVAVPTTSLLAPFCNDRCPALRGKPRIVIFQACRGDTVDRIETDGSGEGLDSAAVATTDAHPPSLQHELQLSFKDFIVGYPTQTGFRSFRNTKTGSWYINALTRVFAERSCDTEVSALLRLVNECVSGWVANSEDPKLYKGSQCAMIHDSLTRAHLFLFPGISRTTS